jgi:hypothetical protein
MGLLRRRHAMGLDANRNLMVRRGDTSAIDGATPISVSVAGKTCSGSGTVFFWPTADAPTSAHLAQSPADRIRRSGANLALPCSKVPSQPRSSRRRLFDRVAASTRDRDFQRV